MENTMKYFFKMIACSVILLTNAFATNTSIENDEIFLSNKKICQGVFPDLNEKLNAWGEHHKKLSKMEALIIEGNFKEVANCMEAAKEMDILSPDIISLSSSLFSSLATLDKEYPNLKGQLLKLLEIKDQYTSITNNLALFTATMKQHAPKK